VPGVPRRGAAGHAVAYIRLHPRGVEPHPSGPVRPLARRGPLRRAVHGWEGPASEGLGTAWAAAKAMAAQARAMPARVSKPPRRTFLPPGWRQAPWTVPMPAEAM